MTLSITSFVIWIRTNRLCTENFRSICPKYQLTLSHNHNEETLNLRQIDFSQIILILDFMTHLCHDILFQLQQQF